MRFGRITRAAAVAMCAGMALLEACGPKASNQRPSQGGGDPSPSAATKPAEIQTNLILIPAGKFTMGDPEQSDAPPHEVEITSFLMDRFLVTQNQFQRVMAENPSRWKAPENPVEQVRWSDAAKFCNRRSEAEGLRPCYDLKTWTCDFDAEGYRLPTEAEWEYACRAGARTAYFFGDTTARLGDYAWFDQNAGGHPRPVGQKKPNGWGAYDICGDLWEWCNDFYKVDYYGEAPRRDPRGPAAGESKVVRGGAWRFGAESCRCGYRYNEKPGYADVCFGYDIYGFRCVRKAQAKRDF